MLPQGRGKKYLHGFVLILHWDANRVRKLKEQFEAKIAEAARITEDIRQGRSDYESIVLRSQDDGAVWTEFDTDEALRRFTRGVKEAKEADNLIRDLEDVLGAQYRYSTKRVAINHTNPDRQVYNEIREILRYGQSDSDLIIIYYLGHGDDNSGQATWSK